MDQLLMPTLAVKDFGNRGSDDSPYGYIEFNDDQRISYAPAAARGVDFWGLGINAHGLTQKHIDVARSWISDHRMPTHVDFHPVGV